MTPEETAKDKWNDQADKYNQWDSLGDDEKQELIAKEQTNTPITDEHEFDMLVNRHPNMWEKVVKSEIARRLERECDNATSDWRQADTDSIRAIHERNEAWAQRDTIADALREMLKDTGAVPSDHPESHRSMTIRQALRALALLKEPTP